jgi:NAD+ kinase
VSQVALITHTHPETLGGALNTVVKAAQKAGVELATSAEEHSKLGDAAASIAKSETLPERPDLCLVLGGDGSILYAMRRYADTGVPVFGINFGTIGFLAAIERENLKDGLKRAFAGEFEVVSMPGLEVGGGENRPVGLNDVSFTRSHQGRVAELSYRVAGEEVGHVRCDGLVAATPAGSTGYNLANGGPILAWGVEGFVVSFIAPHTLTARALVVAPGDVLLVQNAAGREPVEVALDGDPEMELGPGEELEVRFRDGVGSLAEIAGATFYHRMREKFGRLAR